MQWLVAQSVQNLPAMQEARVQSLGREDPLEKEMGTHASILAWRTPWTEKPGRLQSMGSPRVRDTTEQLTLSLFTKCFVLFQECVSSSFYLIIRTVPLVT